MALSIILIFLFLLLFVNISFASILNKKSALDLTFQKYLDFSIIIAAKNEEQNITSLINSFQKLDYPKKNFEVIIIDDNSSDKTYKITEELIQNICNFYLFEAKDKELTAKKGALNCGIKKARYPYILITDADCRPKEDWLKFYSQKFQDAYDFVFGNAPFTPDNSFINKISCFENLRSSILSFSLAKIGLPYSISARNFGFKKSSFEKIKGYSNTTETLSGDDDLLLREAVKNKLKIDTILDRDSFVYSSTKNNLKEYLNQKARHTKTSLYYSPGRQLWLASWHVINLFFLLSPLLIFFNNLFILLFLIKLIIDLLVVKSLQKKFGYKFNMFEILYLQIIYEFMLIVHFINALFMKDKWK